MLRHKAFKIALNDEILEHLSMGRHFDIDMIISEPNSIIAYDEGKRFFGSARSTIDNRQDKDVQYR